MQDPDPFFSDARDFHFMMDINNSPSGGASPSMRAGHVSNVVHAT